MSTIYQQYHSYFGENRPPEPPPAAKKQLRFAVMRQFQCEAPDCGSILDCQKNAVGVRVDPHRLDATMFCTECFREFVVKNQLPGPATVLHCHTGEVRPVEAWRTEFLGQQKGGIGSFGKNLAVEGSGYYTDGRFLLDLTALKTGWRRKLENRAPKTEDWRQRKVTVRDITPVLQLTGAHTRYTATGPAVYMRIPRQHKDDIPYRLSGWKQKLSAPDRPDIWVDSGKLSACMAAIQAMRVHLYGTGPQEPVLIVRADDRQTVIGALMPVR